MALKALATFVTEAAVFNALPIKIPGFNLVPFLFLWMLKPAVSILF